MNDGDKVNKNKEKWKKELSENDYLITREAHTERAFTGIYWDHFDDGVYRCKCCEAPLFESTEKFESGCGWPSFSDGNEDNIYSKEDRSHGMIRTEVLCKKCDAHLGHLFNDGPQPNGLRFCINSASIDFDKKQ